MTVTLKMPTLCSVSLWSLPKSKLQGSCFYMGFNLLSVKPQKQCFYFALLIFNEYSSIIPFSCISKNAVALWLRITNPDTHCRRIANPTGRVNIFMSKTTYPQNAKNHHTQDNVRQNLLIPFGIDCPNDAMSKYLVYYLDINDLQ